LSYWVTVGGTTVQSEVQVLTVQAAPLLVLPQPLINRLDPGATLDLSSFNGDARASVAPWRGIEAGQVICVKITGGAKELKVVDDYRIGESEVASGLVNKPVARSWLTSLSDHQQITVTCEVKGRAVSFQSTQYFVVQVPIPKLRMTWPFNSRTFEGWTPRGTYVNELFSNGEGVGSYTSTNNNYGLVMTCPIKVQAGKTYDFSFAVRSLLVTGRSGTMLQLTINGAGYGPVVDTRIQQDWKTGSAVYTSPVTGVVELGVFNHIASGDGNDFIINYISVWER
ncbi:carbohydrate binding domain-containing protein, partial [Pseudomonas sp. 1152_12]|uniref:carbohydrate binding domain-containing protein n=1 Tax=Pseudomonas sp. 1152_12 TaxID=2604455 RepID=UPI0040636845